MANARVNKNPKSGRKRALILEYRAKHSLERAGLCEIRAIEAELRRLGASNTSASYIASVLREAGTRLDLPRGFDGRYLDPAMDDAYAARLDGVLQFRDLETAEAAIVKLDAIYREYRSVSDRVGTNLVRELAIKGKQRAESLARNPRVNPEKRREKQEIASWFRVWLEVPDLFFDWVAVRTKSEEFRQAFPKYSRPVSAE